MVAHLNIHSAYDLLNSSLKISDAVSKATKEGYSALAITDTNVLYAYPQFYDACVKANIKPIFGMTIWLTDGLTTTETVLLARNNQGLTDLLKLSSAVKMKERTETTIEWLQKYAADLVIIFKSITDEHQVLLEAFADHDMVYVDHQSEQVTDIPAVWIQSANYLNEEDASTIRALHAIRDNTKLDLVNEAPNYHSHLFSTSEHLELDVTTEQLERTEEIAQQCTANLSYHQSLLPKFKTPNGMDSKAYLLQQLQENLAAYDLTHQTAYVERLHYEYDIITNMGFEDYFLIVSDLIQFAKNNDVLVGPGRGSAAGSLVSYLLGITNIDPIKYNLLFERFLNPERVTMPDIDVDFSDLRRDEVIEYVREKYGQTHVAQIITFGTFAARSLIRELVKTLDISDDDMYFILKEM